MQYFFMTAGSLSERDYNWWKYTGHSLEKVMPDELPQLKIEPHYFTDWLDGDSTNFSLFLGRNTENQLFLVICNLETKRWDHQRRKIRNSIVLISEEDERIVRHLAAAALDNSLQEEIAKALDQSLKENTDATKGWLQFDSKQWENFLKSDELKNQVFSVVSEEKCKKVCISNDTKENREFVRSVLLAQDSLPDKVILVVVTGFKESKFYMEQANEIYLVLTKSELSEHGREEKNTLKTIFSKFTRSHVLFFLFFAGLVGFTASFYPDFLMMVANESGQEAVYVTKSENSIEVEHTKTKSSLDYFLQSSLSSLLFIDLFIPEKPETLVQSQEKTNKNDCVKYEQECRQDWARFECQHNQTEEKENFCWAADQPWDSRPKTWQDWQKTKEDECMKERCLQ